MAIAKDEWTLNQVSYKDSELVSFFRKNQTPAIAKGHPDYQWIAYLTFNYEPDAVRGFPSKDIHELLNRIEDEEFLLLEEGGLSVYVASVLKNGIKDNLFYTKDPQKFLDIAARFKEKYEILNVEAELIKDPKWEHYEDFP